MIVPRKHLVNGVERDVQIDDERENILKLDMNEYAPYANEQLYKKLFDKLKYEDFSSYPLVNLAYKSISKMINEPIEKIVLTNGSDGVILSTFLAFCNDRDKVAYISPTYGMYQVYAEMLNLDTVTINYNEELHITEEELMNAIDQNIKVLLIANPNGIIGEELNENIILKVIKKANEKGVIILLDEVYADFQDYGVSKYIKYTDKFDNLIIARSFSKSYGLAGLRAGYSISNENTRKYLIKVRNNVEINSIAVEAIKIWCENQDLLRKSVNEINKSKDILCDELNKLNIFNIKGSANFILIKLDKNDLKKFRQILEKNNIVVKYLNGILDGYIRVTVGTEEYMKKFIKVIQEFVKIK